MPTIRQQIVALLAEKPMDIVALSQYLGLREKETLAHLPTFRNRSQAAAAA